MYTYARMINRTRMVSPLIGLILLGLTSSVSCKRPGGRQNIVSDLPYDFSNPSEVFDLPRELNEISGLGLLDSLRLIAVQDERSIIYVLRVVDGTLERKVDFGRSGDYEGVESVGTSVFILRSDGDLFILKNWKSDKPERVHIRTRLSSRYDAEGLAYDPATNKLLILCKEYPGKGYGESRAVYAFDLLSEKIGEEPLLLISGDSLSRRAAGEPFKFSRFKPAGVAVHPISGNYYMVSSRDRRLVVIDRKGRIISTLVLNHKRIRQPEGLAFLANGDLFLASEAAGGRAALLRFNYMR